MMSFVDEDPDEMMEGLRWQQETASYRDELLEIAQASRDFAGAELRHATRELIVFSAGPAPQEASALLHGAPPNIQVRWREAPYSLRDLTTEVQRLMREHAGLIHTAGARHDGSGIDVTTTDQELLASDDPTRTLGARYPIRVDSGERPVVA
jgi:hypothetical protein